MGYMNYEERLEVAKRLYELSNDEQKTALECIFPELCESEDEKVREDIISLVNEFWERIGSINPEYSSRSRMLAWLEKQGTSYTKKDVDDAFIEKALKFLDEKFYFNNLHYCIESGVFDSEEEMFEDFKNYMKGE